MTQALEDSKRNLYRSMQLGGAVLESKTNLDKRLENIFGGGVEKGTNGNSLKAEIEKNNEKKESKFAALEKDLSKMSAVKKELLQPKRPDDEPYDPEKEYQKSDADGKLTSNGGHASSRTRSQSNGKSKQDVSPEKKVSLCLRIADVLFFLNDAFARLAPE